MNIAVVDDEEVIREQISGFIKKQNPDSNISDFATGEELLTADPEFDIIFLAIQMKGMGVIEAAKTIRQSNVDKVIIFITGIKEHAFEAFDVSAFHHLPFQRGEGLSELYSVPAADVFSFVITVAVMKHTFHKMDREGEKDR